MAIEEDAASSIMDISPSYLEVMEAMHQSIGFRPEPALRRNGQEKNTFKP